jgi:sortase A
VPRRKSAEDLSLEELRRLLVQKQREVHQARLEHFQRTGRLTHLVWKAPAPETSSTPEEIAPSAPGRHFLDSALLAIEILAVIGLIGVLLNGLGLLRTLNQEVAAALRVETPTPTPLIMAVVLPGGHTPPDASGNTRPNEAEIPEHLRPIYQSLASLPVPTPGPQQAIRIQIPAIGVDAPVVQGDGWEQLKKGVGQHIPSANPGENGNVVLSGHNDVYGEIFRHLDRLQPGDQVILYTQQRAYTYIVERTLIVEPTAVEVMASTGAPTLTLISCYPYLVDTHRIVVFARLQP